MNNEQQAIRAMRAKQYKNVENPDAEVEIKFINTFRFN
jgi:hypothetical protein